jgi:hypothetical protein
MEITLLIGIAAVIFVAGVIFIAKGMTSEERNAVPISSPEEIAALKSTFSPAAAQQIQTKPQTSDRGNERHGGSEMESARHANESLEKVEKMQMENIELRKQLAEQQARFVQLEQTMIVMKTDHDKTKDSGSQKIKELEKQIVDLQREKERLLTARELLDELKSKNEVLKKQYDEHKIQQAQMQAIIHRLEEEKNDLLKMQRTGIDRSELEAMSNRLAGSISAIEMLKSENKELKLAYQNLEETFNTIERFNTHLLEKEKIMQYELIKNRAQALGLEKICENFKIQIESMAAATSAT